MELSALISESLSQWGMFSSNPILMTIDPLKHCWHIIVSVYSATAFMKATTFECFSMF